MTKVDTITDSLRSQILAGEFGKGRLPTTIDLARQYGASRDTLQKVIARLEAEGIVTAKGERGVVIAGPRIRIPGITARFDLALQEQGLTPFEKDIDAPAIIPAPPEIAEALGIREGEPTVRRFRVQGANATPYRLAENFYSPTLVDDTLLQQMQQDERLDVLLAIKKTGRVIVRVHEDVIGRLPTTRERELLKTVSQTPVLEVKRINYAEDDTVIMVNRIIIVARFVVLSYDYITSHWKK